MPVVCVMDGNTVILLPELVEGSPLLAPFLGSSLLERHIRLANRMGATRIILACQASADVSLIEEFLSGRSVPATTAIVTIEDVREIAGHEDESGTLVLCGNYLVEQPLLRVLCESNQTRSLVDSAGGSVQFAGAAWLCEPPSEAICMGLLTSVQADSDVALLDIETLPTFNPALRRHRRSGWVRIDDGQDLARAKDLLIDGSQKGSLDIPAKYLHAPLENALVARIAESKVTPNQITVLTTIAAWVMTWLMFSGHVWAGLAGAAIIGILDGVDGKLARLKLMTSRLGEMEHLLDMMFEYSWWLALGWTLSGGDVDSPIFWMSIGLILCNFGDTLAGVLFWVFRGRSVGRTIDNYSPFDVRFRLIGGRRNIYIWMMLLLGPIFGLESAFIACFWWGVATVCIRMSRALLHVFRPRDSRLDKFLVH